MARPAGGRGGWSLPALADGGGVGGAPVLRRRGSMEDLKLVAARGIGGLFGWERVPDPTTFGRWLRRAGPVLVPALERAPLAPGAAPVGARWACRRGSPWSSTRRWRSATERSRPGRRWATIPQAGPAEPPSAAGLRGRETGDCLGVRWRPGGKTAWSGRGGGRMDRGAGGPASGGRRDGRSRCGSTRASSPGAWCATLQDLGVSYFLKVPNHQVVRRRRCGAPGASRCGGSDGSWRGRPLGVDRLGHPVGRPAPLARGPKAARRGRGHPSARHSRDRRHPRTFLTDREGIHALTAWRAYNRGAVVELRIKELGQLQVGRTAVERSGRQRPPVEPGRPRLGLLHTIRSQSLSGPWRTATPDRLRSSGSSVCPAGSPAMLERPICCS